jgi:uncharacterized repeat protein (TIGR04052 family)
LVVVRFTIICCLFFSCLPGCLPTSGPLDIPITVKYQGLPVDCGSRFNWANGQWRIDTLSLYIANVQWDNQPVSLLEDRPVALVGLLCESQKPEALLVTLADVPHNNRPGELTFEVGVPFAINHQNPLHAKAPLNRSDMFWSWQLGYKFLRLDLVADDGQRWAMHLGSIGCDSSSAVRAPAAACAQPNLSGVQLREYQPGQALELHLDKLLLDQAEQVPSRCMGDNTNPSCARAYQGLTESAFTTAKEVSVGQL